MTSKGIITEIQGDIAIVSVKRTSSCGQSCAMCGACNQKKIITQAINSVGANIGDYVTLELETKKVMFGAFLMYIMPVGLLIASGVMLRSFTAAIAMLALYIWSIKRYNKKISMPKIVGKEE